MAIWLAGAGVLAQPAGSRPPRAARSPGNDEHYARLVKQWTTRPEFLGPVVDHLPDPQWSRHLTSGSAITSASRGTGEYNLVFNALLFYDDLATCSGIERSADRSMPRPDRSFQGNATAHLGDKRQPLMAYSQR